MDGVDGLFPHRAAVLGAGAMGVRIAALFANAGVATLLFDLPNVSSAETLARLHDSGALALPARARLITVSNYCDDLRRLRDCDLIVEAIRESLDDKQGFYARVAPYLGDRALFVTTTSGLSIARLAAALPENRRGNFCGAQFFNPPQRRRLVELVAHPTTDPHRLDALETFLTDALGRRCVRAADVPHFIANRVGLPALLLALHHAERYLLPPDLTDALAAAALDLDEAPFAAVDRIGPDRLIQALAGGRRALPDDPWLRTLTLPGWLSGLDGPVYDGGADATRVYDPTLGARRAPERAVNAAVAAALASADPAERLLQLRACRHPQAQFLWDTLSDVLHCCAVQLDAVADSVYHVDVALCEGFGWRRGPFALWQSLGWRQVAGWLEQRRRDGRTLAATALPDWVHDAPGAYSARGAYAPARGRCVAVARPAYPTPAADAGAEVLFAHGPLRLWRPPHSGAVVLSCGAGSVDPGAFADAVAHAAGSDALVLWDVGGRVAGDDATLERLCATLRDAPLPVVAAVGDDVDGAGLALLLCSDRAVTLLTARLPHPSARPAAAVTAALLARAAAAVDDGYALEQTLQPLFDWLLNGDALDNTLAARRAGLLTPADAIVQQPDRLLPAALAHAAALATTAYRPPHPPDAALRGRADAALRARLDQHLAAHADAAAAAALRERGLTLIATLCGDAATGSDTLAA